MNDERLRDEERPSSAKRPRGELFVDPAAKVVWAGICALDEASQYDVLDELQARLALIAARTEVSSTTAGKIARGIAALREAAAIIGGSPSVQKYRRLRDENHLDWPPDGSIRRWLGTGAWNDALQRAHLEAVPDPDVASEAPEAITREVVIKAIRECAADLEHVPTFSQYRQWTHRPDVRKRPGRRPSSQSAFDRLFDGWVATLIAAGLSKEDGSGAPLASLQRSGRHYRNSEERTFEAIRVVMDRLGSNEFPSMTAYSRVRQELLEENPREPLPSYQVIYRRYESWAKAAVAFRAYEERIKNEVGRETDGRAAIGESTMGESAMTGTDGLAANQTLALAPATNGVMDAGGAAR